MGKEKRNKAAPGAAKKLNKPAFAQDDPTWLMTGAVATCILLAAWSSGQSPLLHSQSEGRCFFLVRCIFFLSFDAIFSRNFSRAFIKVAVVIARRLPGAVLPADEASLQEEDRLQNDPTLTWPPAGANIPSAWVGAVSEAKLPKGAQPYFLNHVRGCVRIRQAALRMGAGVGTLVQVAALSLLMDRRSLGAIGLHSDVLFSADLWLGALTGATCVGALFFAEVSVGWLKVIGFCETVAEGEWLSLNLLWDVIFHVGVSINEEVSMRGWLLVNIAQYALAYESFSASGAAIVAVGVQSLLFAVAHLNSPGATIVGLFNLTVGGIAGALNVYLTGGLSFSLGWHFSWNILMGHLLGMSTSGIPMSSKLVSVVPDPTKAKLHGGRFGPEQSPLAPAAYALGALMLVTLYYDADAGFDHAWRALLATP
jgi:membrane protease YdiL (CAAX protease family)